MPGGLGQGTESLTGVLEATVRDPYRSGPQRQTDQRDPRVTGTTRRRQAPQPIFTSARRHRKEPQLLIRSLMSVVPGETVIRIGACGGRDGPVQRDSWGLLIRSGDGDLFGQTAAQAPTRTRSEPVSARRRRSMRSPVDHRSCEPPAAPRLHRAGPASPGQDGRVLSVAGAADDWCDGGPRSPGH
jgi:hypothetical protein